MAIQQVVTIQITLVGDGVSTVFTYVFNKLFDITLTGDVLIDANTLPTAAEVSYVASNLPPATAAIDGSGNLVITFDSAPGVGVSGPITVLLFFASNLTPASNPSASTVVSVTGVIGGGVPTNFGVAPTASGSPASTASISVNASIFAGTTALTTTGSSLNVATLSEGPTGSPVPPDADYLGLNVGGTLRGWTGWATSGGHFTGQIDLTSAAGTVLTGPTFFGVPPSGFVIGVNASISNTFVTPVFVQGQLTNNNTAPTIQTLLGVTPAIAETAYNTVTYTTGNQVMLVTDLHGALNQDLQAVAGVQLGSTAVVAYGSTPAAVNVPAVNAFITNTVSVSGTVAATQSGVWTVGASQVGTWSVAQQGAWGVSATQVGTWNVFAQQSGTWSVDATAIGTITNNASLPTTTLVGVLPALAETAYNTLSYTPGAMVLPVTDLHGALNQDLQAYAGTQLTGTVTAYGTAPTGNVFGVNAYITNTIPVNGALTNNNAAPAATNLGVLPAIAETAWNTITYTTGNQVLPVTDLHGALNFDLQAIAGVAVDSPNPGVLSVAITGNTDAVLDGVITAATAPPNGLAVLNVYNSTPPVLTTGQSVALQCDTTGSHYVDGTGRQATYSAAARGFVPVASATSPLFSIQGSASKVIKIRHITLSWSCTTGAALATDVSMQRFSALTGGTTGSTPALASDDTTNPAGTAVVLQYSAVPTVATAVGGLIRAERMVWITSSATTAQSPAVHWDFSQNGTQAITLRGIADYVGIYVTAVGGTPIMTIRITWTEE